MLRSNVATRAFLTPIPPRGSLGGRNLSPDDDTLAVANREVNALTQTKTPRAKAWGVSVWLYSNRTLRACLDAARNQASGSAMVRI